MRRISNLMYWYYQYNDSVEHYDQEKQMMCEKNILDLFQEFKEWMTEMTAVIERNKIIREKGMDEMNIKEIEVA